MKNIWPWLLISLLCHGALLASVPFHTQEQAVDSARDNIALELQASPLAASRVTRPAQHHSSNGLNISIPDARPIPREASNGTLKEMTMPLPTARLETEDTVDALNETRVAETQLLAAATEINATETPSSFNENAAAYTAPRELAYLLHVAIERQKRYPHLAQRRGDQGIATVNFLVLPNGYIETPVITRSSGNAILDSAALDAVHAINPFPPAAGHLSHAEDFQIDIAFRLD